jgi:hypothetical protein
LASKKPHGYSSSPQKPVKISKKKTEKEYSEDEITDDDYSTLKCKYCCKEYRSEVWLKKHIRNEHIKVTIHQEERKKSKNSPSIANNPYKCKECGVSYKHSTNLSRHNRDKHGGKAKRKGPKNEDGNHKCLICGITYAQRSSLSRHLRKEHADDYEYVNVKDNNCPKCGKPFPSLAAVRTHIAKKHAQYNSVKGVKYTPKNTPEKENEISGPVDSRKAKKLLKLPILVEIDPIISKSGSGNIDKRKKIIDNSHKTPISAWKKYTIKSPLSSIRKKKEYRIISPEKEITISEDHFPKVTTINPEIIKKLPISPPPVNSSRKTPRKPPLSSIRKKKEYRIISPEKEKEILGKNSEELLYQEVPSIITSCSPIEPLSDFVNTPRNIKLINPTFLSAQKEKKSRKFFPRKKTSKD